MNIIHSSSQAFYPVAYNKPQPGNDAGSGKSAVNAGGNSETQRSELIAQPSSTEQIKTALSNAGLSNGNTFSQPYDTRTQKALNAYTQNLNQASRLRVAQSISGIDLYA